MTTVPVYPPAPSCSECKGSCCKHCPGAVFPDELGTNEEDIKKEIIRRLQTGDWCVDWWDGDPRYDVPVRFNPDPGVDDDIASTTEPEKIVDRLDYAYYFRPAIKGRTNDNKIFDGCWGGECIFLTDEGCSLPFDNRPLECRSLEPRPKDQGGCVTHNHTRKDAGIAWIPFWDFFENLRRSLWNNTNELKDDTTRRTNGT